MRFKTFALFALPALTAALSMPARSESHFPASVVADKVIVLKSKRKLLLMEGNKVLKTYHISLGGSPIGPKATEGDSRTPEGIYVLDWHNEKSHYHRSIHISYPDDLDRQYASERGVSPGGQVFLHGLPSNYHGKAPHWGDWTDGCIAVTNAEMDEIWRAVPDGTPIEIRP
jgi:murein L,D-transpeptidase YafK